MTAQMPDKFIFEGEEYELIGMTRGELFTPELYGMKADMIHTACYRGFIASYELTPEALYLRSLELNEPDDNYLPIGGVMSDGRYYSGLSEVMAFTGKIRLAKDLIPELFIRHGFQKATAFRTVFDITLKDGLVVEVVDRSEELEKRRGEFKRHFESGDIYDTTAEAYSLDMALE